jgi:protein TonB
LGIASMTLMAGGVFAQASAPAGTPAEMPTPHLACQPLYPEAALRAQVQGVSHLAFHVDENGKVTSSEVVKSSGNTREHRMLDQAALKALVNCPITVGRDENGKPIASVVTVNYTWLLQ